MNHTDELTDRLIDGTLTGAEAVELHDLLADDPGARTRHLAAVRLELVLRGLRSAFDFAEPTVAKIESDRAERTTTVVMAELANLPPPGTERLPFRNRRMWLALAALTAAVLVGLWLARPAPAPAPVPTPRAHPAPDLARLTTVTGSVEIVGPGGTSVARADQTLSPDQTLRTVGEESVAVLEFADRTRVEVQSDTAVRVLPTDGADPRKVLLLEGRVTAVATGRRIVVGAGTAEVEASRGSFSLCSSGPGSVRVEPVDGDVRVVRGAPADPVIVGPGRAAFVRDEQTPVRIEASARIDSTPRDRLNFMALDAGFTPDGEVWAVSAKQWARWRPGTPDPGRIAFPPKIHNDGLASWLTPDLRAVALCRIDDKEERIVIRALPSGEERGRVPVRVSEPRFLCVGPDASWVATAGGPKSQNRHVRVWNTNTGEERFVREVNNTAYCLAASPDGKWLAVGVSDLGKGTDNAVVVFDAATGDRVFELPTRRKAVTTLAFTADCKYLAAGFNGAIQIWDVPDRKLVKTLEGFERVVTRLAFDPQGKVLAAGTQDGQVWVWSADTWNRRQVLEAGTRGVRSVAFSADGKFLVTTTNKVGVAVWEVAPEPAKAPDPDA
ncbi:MAG: hypothetical protein FJ304_10565 [Planctomycetes bacterium]|nr:hypothetical protein [Planctomycetota bacterium]